MEKFRQIVFEGLLDSKMKKEFSICFLDTSYFAGRFNPPVDKIGVIDIFILHGTSIHLLCIFLSILVFPRRDIDIQINKPIAKRM